LLVNVSVNLDQAVVYCSYYFGSRCLLLFPLFGSCCWLLFPLFWIRLLVTVPIILD
jgi:hypothetical protein